MRAFGHVGLAIATSFSGVMAALILGILLVRRGKLVQMPFALIAKLCLASAFMAAGLLGIKQVMPALPNAVELAVLVFVGAVIYLVASMLLKVIPKGILRRTPPHGT
jgi:peptidoglycan biosynthesis protein MviN/MurJ (putative lipid II flippase)